MPLYKVSESDFQIPKLKKIGCTALHFRILFSDIMSTDLLFILKYILLTCKAQFSVSYLLRGQGCLLSEKISIFMVVFVKLKQIIL